MAPLHTTSSSSAAAPPAAPWPTGCSADPANRVLVLEAGRPDYPWDVFIHMPAALTFPIGSRFYDWKYESEPEPHMNGRRDLPRPRQGARRLEQHQRDDLPARQPAGLRALGRRPGHGDLGLRPLPAVLQADGELPGRRPATTRSAATTARWCWSAARPPTRCSAPSSRRSQQAGYPLHRRRQRLPAGGLRPVRPQRPPRPAAVGGPGLPAPGDEPAQPRRCSTRAFVTRVLFEGKRAVGVEYQHGRGRGTQVARRRGHPVRRRDQLPAAAAALRRRQRRGARARSASTSCTTCPASARTCRTTSRSTSSTPASSRSRCSRTCKWRYRPLIGAEWLFLRKGPGATNHFEGGGFARSNDDVAYPNLMFHFLPIAVRYDGSSPGRRPRLPGARRADVLRRPRLGEDHAARTRACTRRCGSTTSPPSRTGASGSRRSAWPGASSTSRRSTPFNGGEVSPGPGGRDRRADPRLGAPRRRDRAAPVLHLPDGRRRDGRSSTR